MDAKRHRELTRVRRAVEWVIEPNDQYGDILDPIGTSARTARTDAAAALADFPEAVHVDVARLIRTGSEAEGEMDRQYDYRFRLYRGGREVPLRTSGDGLRPIEAA